MSSSIVSVAVPHLNQPEHLQRCLASLAQQSFDLYPVEIIVVDNGSTGCRRVIVPVFRASYWSRKPPPAPVRRDPGGSRARGKSLAFIDADATAESRLADGHPGPAW